MIKTAEEGVLMLFGENMAIGLMVKALIATHPNPTALRAMVETLQKQAAAMISKTPPPNLQLFRFEQLLDEFVKEIPTEQ